MRIWLLRPLEKWNLDPESPWYFIYDMNHGFIIEATNEVMARQIANLAAGDENRSGKSPWLKPEFTSCVELKPSGENRIIMQDFHPG